MSVTARDLCNSALILTGALAQGEDAGPGDLSDAFTRLNRMMSAWKNQRLTMTGVEINDYPLVGSQSEYWIGPGGDFNQFCPTILSYVGLVLDNTSPEVEIKQQVITVKDWSFQSVKSQTSTQPTQVYYDTTFQTTGAHAGMRKIIVWPVPTNVNTLRLYCPKPLTEFSNLSTAYTLPEGAEDAIEYNLAVRLIQAGMGLREHLSDIVPMAKEALGNYKRANVAPVVASIDPALYPRARNWNWRSGEYNGG